MRRSGYCAPKWAAGENAKKDWKDDKGYVRMRWYILQYFYRYKFQLFQTAVSDSCFTLVRLGLGLGETHWNSIATWFWGTSIIGPCQNVKCWYGVMVSIHWSFDLTSTAELFVVSACITFLSCMNIGTTVTCTSSVSKIVAHLLKGHSTNSGPWCTKYQAVDLNDWRIWHVYMYYHSMSFPLMRTAMKNMNNFQIDFIKSWKFHVVST